MQGLFLGMTTLDIIHYTSRNPESNEKISADETRIYTGGPAANAAVTFALLGGKAQLVSYAGKSSLTEVIEEELSRYGVAFHNLSDQQGSNPVVASVVVNTITGDRSVVGVKLPAAASASSLIESKVQPDIVLFDTSYIETAEPYLRWASRNNIPVVLDGGSWKPGLEYVLPYIDYAICSEKFFPPRCSTLGQTVYYLKNQGVSDVCITRGENPILYYPPGDAMEELLVVPAAAQVRDTLGAGDIFHGAFCYYYITTRGSIRKSITAAAEIASKSVCYYGPRSWNHSS